MDVMDRWEHAGVVVEIVHDDDPLSPQENDNAGTIYSWHRWFVGDERIPEPDKWAYCDEDGDLDPEAEIGSETWREVTLDEWFQLQYSAVVVIPLWYEEGRGGMASIYESDNPNCALVFTQEDLEKEWGGSADDARRYAEARIKELDDYLQGQVWGIVIREPSDEIGGEGTGLILWSVWGFIGDPDSGWIRETANEEAETQAHILQAEADEVAYWAARDVVTLPG